MYHWTVCIISIILLSCCAISPTYTTTTQAWKMIHQDVESVFTTLKGSKYWKNNYYKELTLYTASTEITSIFENCGKSENDTTSLHYLPSHLCSSSLITICWLPDTNIVKLENCEQSVLYCYVQELKTVVEELSLLDDQYITDQIENQILHIERNGHLETKTTDSCKKCEEYEEKPIEEFKKGLNTLTQKMQDQGKR